VDWGTNWQNDHSHHRHSTSDQSEIILSNMGPLNILISSSRNLEIVQVLNHLMLRGRES
jgi:hypothetical protein